MKRSGDSRGPGLMKGKPNGPYYKAWAEYLVKFLVNYQREGVKLWGMTVQNEPIMLDRVHEKYPEYFLLGTEACHLLLDESLRLGDWTHAEDYALDIIHDLNHFASGWVDWNLAMDPMGGPSWVRNYLDAPII